MRKNAGFTLMELLVAVGLMVILMTAIVLIFHRSTDVFKINDARVQIYENARSAVDLIASDIQNSVPMDGGQQRFHFKNGVRPVGTAPVGNNVDGAMDYIGMVTVATAPAGSGVPTRELRTVYAEYFLVNDDDAETSFTGAGYTTAQRSQRQIFVLKRRLWGLPTAASLTTLVTQQATAPVYGSAPITPPGPNAATLPLIEEADLCHWVVSFNIQAYYDDTPTDPSAPGKYIELDDATSPYTSFVPLGDSLTTDPRIPRKFRLAVRVIEGAGERQERVFSREIWAPLGG